MADPFAAGLSALHGTGASVAAEYTPPGGAPVRLRVIHEQPSEIVGGGMPEAVMDTHRFIIQRVDVALPQAGGAIVIDPDGAAEAFTIIGDPLLDVEGVSWICPAA